MSRQHFEYEVNAYDTSGQIVTSNTFEQRNFALSFANTKELRKANDLNIIDIIVMRLTCKDGEIVGNGNYKEVHTIII